MDTLLEELEKNPPKRPQNSVMDTLLYHLWDNKQEAAIYLIHGIRLIGRIVNFDSEAVILLEKGKSQAIRRMSITSVMQKPKEDFKRAPEKS